MQPHDRALHIEQPTMKPVPFSQVDSSHPNSSPPIVPSVVGIDGLDPEVTDTSVAVFPEPDVDEKVTEVVARLEVGCRRLRCPAVDAAGE